MTQKSTNPALGSNLEPFAGLPSFMRQAPCRDLAAEEVAIMGIPFDSGTSYRGGTRFGPRKIREASLLLWGHNQILKCAPADELKIVDYGDVDVIPVDIRATIQNIQAEVGAVLASNTTVVALGGDHSVTYPLLQAHAEKFGPVAVVHFDSHPDTWDQEFTAQPYSHGTPFRRAIEAGLIDTEAYIQVGIRGSTSGPDDLDIARKLGTQVITVDQAFEMGIPAVIQVIRETVGNRPTYISLDIDAADPAYAPGTGTPEVGGFTSYQMLQLVRGLTRLNLVGFDLVEVSPPYDHGDITSILAANLVFEFLSLLALQKR